MVGSCRVSAPEAPAKGWFVPHRSVVSLRVNGQARSDKLLDD
jgi:hypothetical protein